MTFLHPEWFWWLLLCLLLWRRFGWRHLKWHYVTLLLIVIAMARPVLPEQVIESELSGSDVIIAVDLSYSMHADDLSPTRLAAAGELLRFIVTTDTKDRFGVIGFTTNAIVLSPLTQDAELLLTLFGRLDATQIITKGTALMGALELARKMSQGKRPKVVLLSDGGDAASYAKEIAYAKAANLQLNVVMLATAAGAPLKKSDGSWLKDEAGHIVISRANRALASLSDATGGVYIDGPDAGALLGALKSQREEDFSTKGEERRYQELFYYAVILAIISFMLAVTTLGRKLKTLVAAVLVLAGFSAQAGMLDVYHYDAALKAYEASAYEEASHHFLALAPSAPMHYNAANALYKAGEYAAALQHYEAVKSADAHFKAAVFYNIGNCYVRLQEFAKARAAYQKSLALHFDEAALQNLHHIAGAQEQDFMISGRQKGKERAQGSAERNSKKPGKEGGSSNMQVEGAGSGAGGEGGKKQPSAMRLDFSKTDAKLSSRQYELINKRSINESKPW